MRKFLIGFCVSGRSSFVARKSYELTKVIKNAEEFGLYVVLEFVKDYFLDLLPNNQGFTVVKYYLFPNVSYITTILFIASLQLPVQSQFHCKEPS